MCATCRIPAATDNKTHIHAYGAWSASLIIFRSLAQTAELYKSSLVRFIFLQSWLILILLFVRNTTSLHGNTNFNLYEILSLKWWSCTKTQSIYLLVFVSHLVKLICLQPMHVLVCSHNSIFLPKMLLPGTFWNSHLNSIKKFTFF